MADGIFFADSLAGSGEETSGRSSVMSPLGKGLARLLPFSQLLCSCLLNKREPLW
jgi:hypothetical protein